MAKLYIFFLSLSQIVLKDHVGRNILQVQEFKTIYKAFKHIYKMLLASPPTNSFKDFSVRE